MPHSAEIKAAMPRTPHIPEPESRRWHVPPPLIRGGAVLEGASLLQEVPGELGILLWQSLRTVTLWASSPPSERSELFLPEAEERRAAALEEIGPEPELREPLRAITEMLGRRAGVEPTAVGVTCTRVAQWALGKGVPATAFEFTQAAAMASPQDPKLALTVAHTARNGAEYSGAEVWYQRTVGLARQAGDWDTYARAYLGLGKMWLARGVYPAARKNLLKARRAAERKGLNHVLGMALHDLFTVESESRRDGEAIANAQAALRAYGPGNPELGALAYDVAFYWLQHGRFAQALPVLRAVAPHMKEAHQVQAQGGLARAAGAVGDTTTFEDAWRAVWKLDDESAGKADTLVEASRGAASLGRWGDAERAAAHALELARQRRQTKIAHDAEGVLESVRSERSADTAPRQAETVPAGGAPVDPADVLARGLVESLEASARGR